MIAIKNLVERKKNQAIVISGESGAGKTETAKQAMKCITYYFKNPTSIIEDKNPIEDKIIGCNPILEAFGNAKTLRNDNSSRFGKYVTIQIDVENKKIEAAQIETFLLEKSRVCEPANGERNYHIFYHILKGADDNMLSQLYLTRDPANYKFLARSKCLSVDTINDEILYKEVIQAFNKTGFLEDEILIIHKVVAACLLLGNADFKEENDDVFVADTVLLEQICILLGCTNEILDKALTQNVKVIQNEVIQKPLKISECQTFRNIFSKELYNRLFNWIVKKLNKSLATNLENKNNNYIGLLDIFGFECFQNNSLEQLFINFTNEKLQQLFINDIFKSESQEFFKEGLAEHIPKINFKDNQQVIDVLDKQGGGLFQLLDDISLTNQTDSVYYEAIKKMHGNNPVCKIKNRPKFFLMHTAKEVEYNVESFIEKNLDEVKSTMTDVARNSKNPLFRHIFMNSLDEDEYQKTIQIYENEKASIKGAKRDVKFLGTKFRNEIAHLMTELNSCQCNYIRCLKPNEIKLKDFFIPTFVFKQIRYLGILDTIRIRKKGYPCRLKFKDFFFKFEEVCWYNEKIYKHQIINKIKDDKEYKDLALQCLNYMVSKRKNEECLVGLTKIYMRQNFFSNLEKLRNNRKKLIEQAVIKIGSVYRKYKFRKEFKILKNKVKVVQKFYENKKYYIRMNNMRKAATLIQATYRCYICCRAHKYKLVCIYKLQNYIRSYLMRKNVKNKIRAGKIINHYMKMFYMKIHCFKQIWMINIINDLVNMALDYHRGKTNFFAALMIQSNTRRYLARSRHSEKVLRGHLKRMQFLQKKSAIYIQKNYRGYAYRSWLVKAFYAAVLIQGFWRMTRYQSLMSHMRKEIKKIQKNVITFLTRKHIIKERCKEFFKNEKKKLQKLIHESFKILFPNFVNINEGNSEECIRYSQYFDTFSDTVKEDGLINYSMCPPYDTFSDNKINLFAKIVDIDIMVKTTTYNYFYIYRWILTKLTINIGQKDLKKYTSRT